GRTLVSYSGEARVNVWDPVSGALRASMLAVPGGDEDRPIRADSRPVATRAVAPGARPIRADSRPPVPAGPAPPASDYVTVKPDGRDSVPRRAARDPAGARQVPARRPPHRPHLHGVGPPAAGRDGRPDRGDGVRRRRAPVAALRGHRAAARRRKRPRPPPGPL